MFKTSNGKKFICLDNGQDHLIIHILTEIREVYIFRQNSKHWEKLIPTVENTQRTNVTIPSS